jgi:hypothetical protein
MPRGKVAPFFSLFPRALSGSGKKKQTLFRESENLPTGDGTILVGLGLLVRYLQFLMFHLSTHQRTSALPG